MKGVSQDLFAPDWAVTRATVVTVLYRMEGEPSAAGDSGFPDVAEDTWYGAAVAWAGEAGIAAGYDTGAFGPDDPSPGNSWRSFCGVTPNTRGWKSPTVYWADTATRGPSPSGRRTG
jgi:hypothetical protein